MNRLATRLLLVAMCASAAPFVGCSPTALRGPHPAVYDNSRGVANPIWQTQLAENPFLVYRPEMHGRAAVDPQHGRVFIGTADDESGNSVFAALDMRSGKTLWKQAFKGAIQSEPLFLPIGKTDGRGRADTVYFGSDNGFLYALNADTGAIQWQYRSDGTIREKPAYHAGRIVFTSSRNYVHAVDAFTGKWLWQYNRDLPAGFTIDGIPAPVVANDAVHVGFADGTFAAINIEDGIPNWTTQLGKPGDFRNVNESALVHNGRLIVPVFNQGLTFLDLRNGELLNRININGPTSPAIGGGRVYVGDNRSRMRAYDLRTRERVWSFKFEEGYALRPKFHKGFVYFATTGRNFFVLSGSKGTIADTWGTKYGIIAAPTISGDYLFLMTNNGWFYGFRFLG